MAGASLVTSIFGNSPAFPDWPALELRFRGVTSRVGCWGIYLVVRCAFHHLKGTNGADYRHHHVPHERRLAWLVGGGCPAALDVRDVHQEQRGPSGPAAAWWRRV